MEYLTSYISAVDTSKASIQNNNTSDITCDIKGHNNYQQGKSYLNISMENAQMLVDKYAGTGEIQRDNSGKWKHTEIITKNKQNIGYVVSAVNGEEIETSFFKIHYSKNGTHIVPYARKEK